MSGDPLDKMLEYAALVGEVQGHLNIHDAAIKGVSLDRRDALFRMHQAESTLNRIKELLKEFQQS